jgi:hypothetical protein
MHGISSQLCGAIIVSFQPGTGFLWADVAFGDGFVSSLKRDKDSFHMEQQWERYEAELSSTALVRIIAVRLGFY